MSLVYNLDHISDNKKKTNIKKAISILEKAYYKNIESVSFFLDPFEQKVISSIAKKNNIDITFLGGNENAERKIFVANYYYLPLYENNYIRIIEFKAEGLSHPDVLGAIMSLGIDRKSIGDISVLEGKVEFAVEVDQAAFIEFNLSKIKNTRVNPRQKESGKLDLVEEEYKDYSGFVSSLRLDNILSEILSTSRAKAKDYVRAKLVKVDFQTIEDPSYTIEEGVSISVRRVGRFIFDGVTGRSKKGNYHIEYRKIV